MTIILPAERTLNVSYAIRDIIVEAKKLIPKDIKVLPLNIGDPCEFDFRTPPHIINSVVQNINSQSAYAPSEGLPEARESVAEYQKQFNLSHVSADDVLITTGGTEAIYLALEALLNPHDNILLPSPGYPAYNAKITFLETEIRNYYLDEDHDWQIDTDMLESLIDEKTKAIVIINPNNPTGAVLTGNTLRQVLLIAQKHNLLVIADEQVYQFYVYEGSVSMCASLGIEVPIISIGSMSKTYLMPGWRLGWMVFHNFSGLSDYKETIMKLKRVQLGSPNPLQKAMKEALLGPQDYVHETVSKLRLRRDVLVAGINQIEGLSLVQPRGAFYAFVKIENDIASDKNFVLELARQTGILCVPGEGFGQKQGTHHFRLVFLPPEPVIRQALDLLSGFISSEKWNR